MSKLFFCLFAAFMSATVIFAKDPRPKNWQPPATKIYAQALADQIMAEHPELISATFHGVPPGLKDVYTMFAGSYPDRIGNPDDEDDIMVAKLGITIIDPRWKRHDPVPKFVLLMPLRDATGDTVGLFVLAFKADAAKDERSFFAAASDIRDGLAKQIPNYAMLFEPAK